MRIPLILMLVSLIHLLHAQVSITSGDLPQAGDLLMTQGVILIDEIELEQTGENQTWYFGEEILQYAGPDMEANCYDVDETPLAYQFLFNNPFDPLHNSDFGMGIETLEVLDLTFEDAYQYYQNNSSNYAMTGMGMSINGIPLAAQANEPDKIYSLPLNYDDSDSSETLMEFTIPGIGYWGLSQQRNYVVDGWGTLVINDMSIEVVRVRSVIHASDSLYSEGFDSGFVLPHPEVIEYKWLSPQYKVPVLQINTTDGMISLAQTANIFESSVIEHDPLIRVYPNPVSDYLTIDPAGSSMEIDIHDMQGRTIRHERIAGITRMDMTTYAAGIYIISATSNRVTTSSLVTIW